jgi:hypothetical protein
MINAAKVEYGFMSQSSASAALPWLCDSAGAKDIFLLV